MPPEYTARPTQKPTIEKRRTCTNCGRLGHLVATCSNPERHHDMVGIEIEGWWNDLTALIEKAVQMTGREGHRDGSLRDISSCVGRDEDSPAEFEDSDVADCSEGCDDCPHPIERSAAPRCSAGKKNCHACGARGWEVQTKPGSVGDALRQLTTMYPDVTSRAAGMHVHMSFKEPTSISLLCSDKFFSYWQERWEAWGTKHNVKGAFWERLRNQNNYCRPNDMKLYSGKKTTVNDVNSNRYQAINFMAWDEHKTVEFRMLPMFQKGNLAVLAVEQLVDIVETYLQSAELQSDISVTTKVNGKDSVLLDPVVNDFILPNHFPEIKGEVDLLDTTDFKTGVVKDDKGQPTGVIRMFQYQVDTYYANAAQDATKIKQKIADPRAHKVQWADFTTIPTGRT